MPARTLRPGSCASAAPAARAAWVISGGGGRALRGDATATSSNASGESANRRARHLEPSNDTHDNSTLRLRT